MRLYQSVLFTILTLTFSAVLPGCGDNDPANPPVDLTPPAAVSNLSVAAGTQTDSSLTLTWTAPGDDGDVGQADTYDLRWSLSDLANDAAWAAATPVSSASNPQPAGTSESQIVSGLNADQTYFFALETLDESQNRAPRSNVAIGSTAVIPDSVVVTPDGTGDYSTIQEAIIGTEDGTVIFISPGIYNEGLTIETKSVTLIGTDPVSCIVTHNFGDTSTSRVLSIDDCPRVHISGLHFAEGLILCGNGVLVSQSAAEFEHCIFDSCGLEAESSELALESCTFYGSTDMLCDMVPRPLIDLSDTEAAIKQCIVFAGVGGGIGCIGTSQAMVECTDCWHNPDPERNYIGCPDPTGSDGNISLDPLVVDAPTGDFHLQSHSPCLVGGVSGCGQIGVLGTP